METAYPDIYDEIANLSEHKSKKRTKQKSDNIVTVSFDTDDDIVDSEDIISISIDDLENEDYDGEDVVDPDGSPAVIEIGEISERTNGKISESYPAWSSVNRSPVNGVINTWGAMKETDITMLEKIPAFERNNAKIEVGRPTSSKEVAMHRLDESEGNHILGENNSFLDRDVD